jgi:hypothetical protein
VRAGEPVRIRPQTRVDRFLSSPQRVDVGMIGGQAGRHLGALGNGAVAGDHDIDRLLWPVIVRPPGGRRSDVAGIPTDGDGIATV